MKLPKIFRGFGKKKKDEIKTTIDNFDKKLNNFEKRFNETLDKYNKMWFEEKTKASQTETRLLKENKNLKEELLIASGHLGYTNEELEKLNEKYAKKDKELKEAKATIEDMKKTYFKREKVPADRSKGNQKMSTIRNRQKQSEIIAKIKD